MAGKLYHCLQKVYVPYWLTKGITTLVIKDESNGAEVTTYRPITRSPVMWKVLARSFSEEIYNHLHEKGFLPLKQKGCRRQSGSTKDQLFIDKMIITNFRRRQTALTMAIIKRHLKIV